MPEVVSPTQARRLKLAEQLIAHGRVSQNPKHPMIYHVSALDNRHTYVVRLTGPKLCTCADFFYRRVCCKHALGAVLVHLGKIAAREEQSLQKSSQTLKRAAPRPHHPIWYEGTTAHMVHCEDCGSGMPPTDPCPNCGRLVCDRCFDGASGVCLGCPGGE